MRRQTNFSLLAEYEKMLAFFERKHVAFLRTFLEEIDRKNNNKFQFIEISEEVCVSLRPLKKGESETRSNLNLGFPFPVISKLSPINLLNFSCEVFFRGENLRRRQREILKNGSWLLGGKIFWRESVTLQSFRKTFFSVISKYPHKKLLYINPYSFIGDSVIGMHFIDGLISLFNFSGRVVLSKSAADLKMLGETAEFSLLMLKKYFRTHRFVVFPDLLDVNFEKTLQVLKSISHLNGVAIFPGRALFVEIVDGKIYLFHLKQADTILRGKNIEDYMNDCLRPFIDSQPAWQESFVAGDSRLVLINPFGSLPNKTIDLSFVNRLCQELLKHQDVEIKILGGVESCPFHQDWVKKFRRLAVAKRQKISLLFFSNLGEFSEYVKKFRPGVIITADTSIAHMATRMNIPNTVFFHAARFDNSSLQSMISESPLGFGRYFNNTFPLLIQDYKQISPQEIASFALFLSGYLNKKHQPAAFKKSLAALIRLFPEKYFYARRPLEERARIKNILGKISPVNKFKQYE